MKTQTASIVLRTLNPGREMPVMKAFAEYFDNTKTFAGVKIVESNEVRAEVLRELIELDMIGVN